MNENSLMTNKDEDRLELSLTTRDRIIRELTKNGIPSSKEDRAFLLDAMNSQDRTLLTKARIKSDDKNEQSKQQLTRNMVADILYNLSVKKSHTTASVAALDDNIKLIDEVPGEKSIGVETFTYNDIMDEGIDE